MNRKFRKFLAFLSGGSLTVSGVVANFRRQIDLLQSIQVARQNEVDEINNEIVDLQNERDDAAAEMRYARTVASNLRSLIS